MLRGGARPTFEQPVEYDHTDAQDAIEMFEAYGRNYYEAQKYQMHAFYARKVDGSYAASGVGIAEPRQNGKSFGARDYALDSACMCDKRVMYSAHHGKTVRSMFKAMCDFVTSTDDFNEELVDVYKAAGSEGIYFSNGCIEFQTRTNSAARGGTYDIVIIDEAQELTDAQLEALLPVISAASELSESDGTQVIYLGTPPNETCVGTVFKSLHDKAHKGANTVWWMEWAAQGADLKQINLDDKELWYACNPAMGRRMSEAAVQNERDTMSDAGFARERLGWWANTATSTHPISQADWQSCFTTQPPQDGDIVYAVKFSYDGMIGTIAAGIKSEPAHVEIVDSQTMTSGLSWVADWLLERKDKPSYIIIDGQAHADDLYARLIASGIRRKRLIRAKPRDLITATSSFCNAVRERNVTHYIDDALDASATKCVKRRIGSDGGFGFSSVEGADETLIEACCLAYWGTTLKTKSNRETRVSF